MKDIEVDFVVPWVDGADHKWQEQFRAYRNDDTACDATLKRYRDWDLMRYWFRCIEKNAPWVRNIYFVTWGHIPGWLNLDNPKLVIVKHEDYIPEDCLPVFNANPIEVNIHRIPGLSEHFVYFNDDMFLINKTTKEDFFVDGLPCDSAIEYPNIQEAEVIACMHANNYCTINRNFDKRKVIGGNLLKWFNPAYGLLNISTLSLSIFKRFTGVYSNHLPQPFLKATYHQVWESEYDILNLTSKSKFRSRTDVSQHLFKSWQLCSGNFRPINITKFGKLFTVCEDNYDEAADYITTSGKKMVCINDEFNDEAELEIAKRRIINAFDSVTEKSSYEL
ncbi:stealth family protein [Vibrio gallicus]|uniref:stealth family protein n=1 Tax=Vibrio gallicus TaxID=190897 RepID=UPI0021C4866C|nr:stealth family protein [Vibrio gallicus]